MTKNCDGGRFLQRLPDGIGKNIPGEFVREFTVILMDAGADETRVGFEVVPVIETAADAAERLLPYRVREFRAVEGTVVRCTARVVQFVVGMMVGYDGV